MKWGRDLPARRTLDWKSRDYAMKGRNGAGRAGVAGNLLRTFSRMGMRWRSRRSTVSSGNCTRQPRTCTPRGELRQKNARVGEDGEVRRRMCQVCC